MPLLLEIRPRIEKLRKHSSLRQVCRLTQNQRMYQTLRTGPNCKGANTANFRGCPSYSEISKNFTAKSSTPNNPSSSKSTYPQTLPQNNTTSPTQLPSRNPPTHHLDYANATKNKPAIKTDKVINLLTELLSAISSTEDPKTIISVTINLFLSL